MGAAQKIFKYVANELAVSSEFISEVEPLLKGKNKLIAIRPAVSQLLAYIFQDICSFLLVVACCAQLTCCFCVHF
ncbi:hypothetical protein BHQ21_10710 [Mycobacterium sherrisii]|uniref:Uncharacterized protein n=1 Tax=Mycobacterium sherrisii TaxID=243061 RepID=A0A1E3SXG9_9MYCO|nr:hypothetical protein BHQ21_10710 [Mycobacterium sherrisii]